MNNANNQQSPRSPLLKNRDALQQRQAQIGHDAATKEAAKKEAATLGGCFGMMALAVLAFAVGAGGLVWLLNLLFFR